MTGASNESCEFNTTPTGTRPKKDTGRDDSVRRSKILAEVADANPNHIRPAEGPCAGMLVDKQSCGESEVVTEAGVRKVQEAWAQAIKSISKVHLEGGDFIGVAGEAAAELYAYGHTNVLFKPTKAAEVQFRPTAEGAMSYFVGAANVQSGPIEEDRVRHQRRKGLVRRAIREPHGHRRGYHSHRHGQLLLHVCHYRHDHQGRVHLWLQDVR